MEDRSHLISNLDKDRNGVQLFDKISIPGMRHFGHRVYPRGSLVIALVSPWSVVRGPFFRPSVFKYLRDRAFVFSNFLHEVRAP